MANTHTKDIIDVLDDYARTHRDAAIAYLESDMFYTAKYEIEHAIALDEQRNKLLATWR